MSALSSRSSPVARFRLALRLARRELRSGLAGFGVFLACLALGVGAVATVGVVSSSMDATLARDARVLFGGDVSVSQTHLPLAVNATGFLRAQGAVTNIISMRTMLRPEPRPGEPQAPGARRSLLVELKAVEPSYPLVGMVEMDGGGTLAEALAVQDGIPGVALERAALLRLKLRVGDHVRLGRAVLRIGGVIAKEPDRPAGFLGLGPRAMIAADTLPATGLLQPGSVVTYAALLRLDDPRRLDAVQAELKARYAEPGWRVRNVRESSPGLSRFFNNFASYLTLVGLASLLVGGIGVANGVQGYLARKDTTIATLKCLGASRRLVTTTYLLQVAALALVGSLIGCGLGAGGAAVVTPLLSEAVGIDVALTLHPAPLLTAIAYGLLTALAFGLWPLSAAGSISPAQLFRGYAEVGDGDSPGRSSRRPSWTARLGSLACALLLVGLTLQGAQQGATFRTTLGFYGGVLATMLVFRLFAWLLMRLAARLPHPNNPRLRMALANLHRPGAATPAVVFSLGLGLTILAAISLVDGNLQYAIATQFPSRAPSYFFIDIQHTQIDQFRALAASIPGVGRVEDEPSLRGRIVRIDGVPVDQREIGEDAQWAVRGDRGLTFAATPPRGSRITAGEWWPADYNGPPLMCLEANIAQGFGVGVGDTLTVSVLGREVTATIAVLRNIDWTSLALNHAIVFTPNALAGAPHAYIATAYAEPEAEGPLFEAVTEAMPGVVAVGVKEVLADVQRIAETIGLAVRAAGLVTVAAGILVLAESLRANLQRRRYEAVVFKVLGATRLDILRVLLWEFLLLGVAAALVAAALGAGLAWLFTEFVLRTQYVLLPVPLAASLGAGVAATLVLGLWAVRSVLSRSAWEFLRNE
ncbi:ABC transporter permease [Megalodesulfovibrio paquesii]